LPSIVLAIKGIKSLLGVCKTGLDTARKIKKIGKNKRVLIVCGNQTPYCSLQEGCLEQLQKVSKHL
jgi:hypothetical protein